MRRLRIAVLGYLVCGPIGGMAWHYLQYVLGLMRLGHDVRFIEDSNDYPACYDPSRHVVDCDPTYGLRFAALTFENVGLREQWAYFDAHSGSWHGPAASYASTFCRTADVIINVSASSPLREWTSQAPVRVLVDTDPAFTQIRSLVSPEFKEQALAHNAYFTFGENIPRGSSSVPDDGLPWRATRQPVVLDRWPVLPPRADAPFTTVMQWKSYRPRHYNGVRYGTKEASFEPYIDVPRRTRVQMEIALGTPDAPRDVLRANGWQLKDPLLVALTTQDYQEYIRCSRGEFTVAKHGFVITRCGWFSERSAGYLASGRPVVTQETGFSEWLSCGDGVLAFNDADEAVAALEEVERDYERHARRARLVAEEYFDSDRVLGALLRDIGVT